MKRLALDLTKYHWRRRYGDLTAYGTWHQTDEGWLPCLVLAPTNEREMARGIMPCILPLNDLWIWSEEIGNMNAAVKQAMNFAEGLGLDYGNPQVCIMVAMVIRDCIGDLASVPPYPQGDSVVVADATISKDGEVIRQVEVSERV